MMMQVFERGSLLERVALDGGNRSVLPAKAPIRQGFQNTDPVVAGRTLCYTSGSPASRRRAGLQT